MTITQIVDQAWQLDRARQQAAAEAIQAALATRPAHQVPHDSPAGTPGALMAVWALAA
jgi:hypothetical protein